MSKKPINAAKKPNRTLNKLSDLPVIITIPVKKKVIARTKPPKAKVIIPLTAFTPNKSPNQIHIKLLKTFMENMKTTRHKLNS